MARNEQGLTPQQELFVSAYLSCLNIRAAGAQAGYADDNCAYRTFREPKIRNEIKRRMTERLGELDITADRVLREIARIAFAPRAKAVQIQTSDLGSQIVRVLDSDLWPVELHAAVKSISQDKDGCIKIDWHDKGAALAMLAKHLNLGMTDDDGGVKVFVVHEKAGSEEEWEAKAKQVQEQSLKRAHDRRES